MNALIRRVLLSISLFAFATGATAQSYDPFARNQTHGAQTTPP